MADTRTIKWHGKSGTEYLYWIHEIGTEFKKAPGNYIFSKETEPGRWTPIYIGETEDLSQRFDNHHKEDCINRRGATHIHVHTSSHDGDERRAEESDLVERWDPPCNG